MRNFLIMFMVAFVVSACDMMDYHPYDTHINGVRHINAANIQQIEHLTRGKKQVRFAVISDTQGWIDETRRIVRNINAQPGIDFVVHCGDLTDFGMTNEFEWMRDELLHLKMPFVAIIGNHDCLGTGRDVFRAMFGEFNCSFNVGKTHFLILNTNGLEFRDAHETPNIEFMKQNLAGVPDSVCQTVVAMHAAPLSDQFKLDYIADYNEVLKQYPNLLFGISGHEHRQSVRYPQENGVPYYLVACAEKETYYIFTLNDDGTYECEEVQV